MTHEDEINETGQALLVYKNRAPVPILAPLVDDKQIILLEAIAGLHEQIEAMKGGQ